MANDQNNAALPGLVDVAFVGGPLHGCNVQMAHPEFQMTLEPAPDTQVVYCRRMVEQVEREGEHVYRATYAPVGTTDDEFARLVVRAALRAPR
jgi:hypothetical protein